jgi:hypothetical protein
MDVMDRNIGDDLLAVENLDLPIDLLYLST